MTERGDEMAEESDRERNGKADRERALARIRAFQKKLPVGWKFDREDANAR